VFHQRIDDDHEARDAMPQRESRCPTTPAVHPATRDKTQDAVDSHLDHGAGHDARDRSRGLWMRIRQPDVQRDEPAFMPKPAKKGKKIVF
jgi:hypothetical protein